MNRNIFLKNIKRQRGVSLIELVVAVGLFAVITLSATAIFKLVIDGQRNSLSAQNVQENMRYAMEKMSKEMRMATIGNHDCETLLDSAPTAVYKVFNTTDSDSTLYFKNQDNLCVAYYLDMSSKRLKIKLDTGSEIKDDYITPAKIEVSDLKFFVNDDEIGVFHSTQPCVTMTMKAKASGLKGGVQEMRIQFSISSRYYE